MAMSAETKCLCSRGCGTGACACVCCRREAGWWCVVLNGVGAWTNGRLWAWQVAAEMFARMDGRALHAWPAHGSCVILDAVGVCSIGRGCRGA